MSSPSLSTLQEVNPLPLSSVMLCRLSHRQGSAPINSWRGYSICITTWTHADGFVRHAGLAGNYHTVISML